MQHIQYVKKRAENQHAKMTILLFTNDHRKPKEETKFKQCDELQTVHKALRSSSPRSISIGQLNTLLCLHLRPIKLVVYK